MGAGFALVVSIALQLLGLKVPKAIDLDQLGRFLRGKRFKKDQILGHFLELVRGLAPGGDDLDVVLTVHQQR